MRRRRDDPHRSAAGRTAALAVTLVLGLAGCGDGPGPSSIDDPSRPTPASADSPDATPSVTGSSDRGESDDGVRDFCAAYGDLGPALTQLATAGPVDLPGTVTAMGTLDGLAASVAPPESLAGEWDAVVGFAATVRETFAGVDLDDDTALLEVTGSLTEEFEQQAESAEGAAETLRAHAEEACGVARPADALPPKPCDLVPSELLQETFAARVPEVRQTRWSAQHVDCVWKVDDQLVGVFLMPASELDAQYLGETTALPDTIPGLPGASAYIGTLGAGRFSTSGHMVGFTTNDLGAIVSVDGSPPSTDEIALAGRVARAVADGLS